MGEDKDWGTLMLQSSGPSLLPCMPIPHGVCKQKPPERSRPGERHSTSSSLQQHCQGAPGHSGRLQCRKERGSVPAQSDPATLAGGRQKHSYPHPNSSGRLAQEPSRRSVCKAIIANSPAVPAASSTWSKTGSESHLRFFPPTSGVWRARQHQMSKEKAMWLGLLWMSCPTKEKEWPLVPL